MSGFLFKGFSVELSFVDDWLSNRYRERYHYFYNIPDVSINNVKLFYMEKTSMNCAFSAGPIFIAFLLLLTSRNAPVIAFIHRSLVFNGIVDYHTMLCNEILPWAVRRLAWPGASFNAYSIK